jgi:hypothetical protein
MCRVVSKFSRRQGLAPDQSAAFEPNDVIAEAEMVVVVEEKGERREKAG